MFIKVLIIIVKNYHFPILPSRCVILTELMFKYTIW